MGDSHPFVQLSFPRRRESMFSREVDSHLKEFTLTKVRVGMTLMEWPKR